MTTSTTTTALAHTNDADFQTWGLELSTMFDAIATFPKSADTGQIDWVTVARPAVSTYAGYEIRYLNDSLHASKPIYVKIQYGTHSTTTRPAIRISAGSATDGAGNLTGITYSAEDNIVGGTVGPQVGTFFSGAVALPGFVGFVWKRGGTSTTQTPTFFICRTCDAAGAPTSTGFNFYRTSLGGVLERFTYISSSVIDGAGYALFPGGDTTSLVSGAPQVMRHFTNTPEIQCVPFMLSFNTTEIGDLSTFTATPVGVTQRTYLAIDGTRGPASCGLSGTGVRAGARIAIQWE